MAIWIAPGAEPIPGYRLLERLGGGGYGEVWKAEAPGGLLKAIKMVHGDLRAVDPASSQFAFQELSALKRVQAIRHPYLLSIDRYDLIGGRLYVVTELADGSLWDRFRTRLKEGQTGIDRDVLLQHLQTDPGLSALPASDRPAVARALAKRPEDRFPSCTAFVKALRGGSAEASAPAPVPVSSAAAPSPHPARDGVLVPAVVIGIG